MYVCLCRVVTDKQVKAAIEAGARTICAVSKACGAGDDCGGCRSHIEDLIEDHGALAIRGAEDRAA